MKQTLLSLLMMLLPLMAHADAVEINGIYYNLTGNGAEVTENPNMYTGDVVIPSSVVYNNRTYSVTSIGRLAFHACSCLTSVTIPNSVTSIRAGAFWGCSGLTSITIPNSVTRLEDVTFSGCSSLTSVTIPNSVTEIGKLEFTFHGCSSLTSVTIPNSVTEIGMNAFQGCSSLTSITIPNSVTKIGFEAFYGCSSLTSVTIPNSVTSIGMNAFQGCSSLTSIAIPNSVTFIDSYAFDGCSGLISIVVESGNTVYDSRDNCNALIETKSNTLIRGCNSTVIPNSVTEIGGEAFKGCSGLISVTIPNSVTKICGEAFKDCSGLISVTIGSGVEQIFRQAFANCPKLTDVYCYAERYNINTNVFEGSYIENATLRVPFFAVNTYKKYAPWSYFKNIVGIGEQYFTLAYLVDGTKYKEYSLVEGDVITAEPEPTKQGYTFSGWSSIPATMPANNVTVTGTFSKNTYKLTYMVDGQIYKTVSYQYGATITPEFAPKKEGYTFSGWSELPATMPEENVTIIGTFDINTYMLTYIVDGQTYKTYDVEYGAAITPETEPTKEGYTFSGWSEISATMPAKDVTVTGSFSINTYKLTYMVDGEVYKTMAYSLGDAILPEAAPSKEGYTFSGWSEIPATMPEEDVTITGTFTPSTGVETAVGSGRPFDVYTVTGRKVRSQVSSLKGLKKGVYIVEGKKVVVK